MSAFATRQAPVRPRKGAARPPPRDERGGISLQPSRCGALPPCRMGGVLGFVAARLRPPVQRGLSAGVRQSMKSLRVELGIQRHHRDTVRRARAFTHDSHLKLHLGSGRKNRSG